MPMARASRANSAPTAPVPITPSTLPWSITFNRIVQRPALTSAVWNAARLATANISAKRCSATAGAVRPGWLETTTPSALADGAPTPAAAVTFSNVPSPRLR